MVEQKAPNLNSPEPYSSFLSRIHYSWVTPLLKLGSKVLLNEDNIYSLPPNLQSLALYRAFQENWDKELDSNPLFKTSERLPSSPTGQSEPASKSSGGFCFPLFKVVYKTFAKDMALAVLSKFLSDICKNLFVIYFSNKFIESSRSGVNTNTIALSFCILFFSVVATYCAKYHAQLVSKQALSIRSGLNSAVFHKAIRLSASNSNSDKYPLGKIINLITTDTKKIYGFVLIMHSAWSAPLQAIIIITVLFTKISWSALIGILLIILAAPLQFAITKFLTRARRECANYTDSRVKLTQEIISGIKTIKYYLWEAAMLDKARTIRESELAKVKKTNLLVFILNLFNIFLPTLATFGSLYTYKCLLGYGLTASQGIIVSILFNLLKNSFTLFAPVLPKNVDARVSLNRINRFLLQNELKTSLITDTSSERAIIFKDLAISSGSSGPLINQSIPKGAFVVIVGGPFSGKSTFLKCINGESQISQGQILLSSKKIGYCSSQSLWIDNTTIKENILFESEFHAKDYYKTLELCHLIKEINDFKSGDQTFVGENGIYLSKTQRQRIQFARLLYADLDIYLLDEPFLGLDSQVEYEIFETCILSHLEKKTRILVTDDYKQIQKAHWVICMRGGFIETQGTLETVISNEYFGKVLKTCRNVTPNPGDNEKNDDVNNGLSEEDEHSSLDSSLDTSPSSQILKTASNVTASPESSPQLYLSQGYSSFSFENLVEDSEFVKLNPTHVKSSFEIEKTTSIASPADNADEKPGLDSKKEPEVQATKFDEEERASGSLSVKYFFKYIRLGGGYVNFLSISVVLISIIQVLKLYADTWLKDTLHQKDYVIKGYVLLKFNEQLFFFIYLSLGLVYLIFTCCSGLFHLLKGIQISRYINYSAFRSLIQAKIGFFRKNSEGRILNRFGEDTDNVDFLVMENMRTLLTKLLFVIYIIMFLFKELRLTSIFVILIMIFFYKLQVFYRCSYRELNRLSNIQRSKYYSLVINTLKGYLTINSLSKIQSYINRSHDLLDNSLAPIYLSFSSLNWIELRIELVNNLMLFGNCIFCIVLKGGLQSDSEGSGFVQSDTAIVYKFTKELAYTVQSLVTAILEWEIISISLERLDYYINNLPKEDYSESSFEFLSWPSKGDISFQAVEFGYEGLGKLFKNQNFEIKGGQKVGLVGENGVGKSAFMDLFYRFDVLSQGKIKIDGIDLDSIPPSAFRNKIFIIPENPTLFSGSLRFNLDPNSQFSDQQIWDALEKALIKPYISSTLSSGLDSVIRVNDPNFSKGKKQLLYLSRAILNSAKILLIDEIDSNLELDLRDKLKKLLFEGLPETTVIKVLNNYSSFEQEPYDKFLILKDKTVYCENSSTLKMT